MKPPKNGIGNTHPPPLTPEQFRATSEFKKFKRIVRNLLAVPKADLDRMVHHAKRNSPRRGNPNAPGRKATRIERGTKHKPQ